MVAGRAAAPSRDVRARMISSELAQTLIAMVLLGVAVVGIARAYVRAWHTFVDHRIQRHAVIAAVAVGAITRLLVPKWIATIFVGYRWTQQCIDLHPLSHYGAGAASFYHAVFSVAPHDHSTIMWTNAVVGVLTIPLVGALAARWLRSPTAGAWTAVMLALVPLIVRNDTSDANNVPVLWWLAGAALLLEEFATVRTRAPLLLGAALATLAAVARPEMPIVAATWIVGVVWACRDPMAKPLRRDVWLWTAAAVAVAAISPHLGHVYEMIGELQQRSAGLPGLRASASRVHLALWDHDTLVAPTLFPAAITALALWGVARAPADMRRRVGSVAAVALVSLLAYTPDLDRANMARVHVPAAVLAIALAAYATTRLPRGWMAAAAVAMVATAAPTAWSLWQPTNELAEERFTRDVIAALPRDTPIDLVRSAYEDRVDADGRRTHDHFPDYLLGRRDVRLLSMRELLTRPSPARDTYVVWGMRCYARFRPIDAATPAGDNLQDHCARVRAAFALEPVFEREVVNRGDVWIRYYGDAETMRLGLYRARRKAGR
jgi:hypothetical protein